jgi:hypothetical protein
MNTPEQSQDENYIEFLNRIDEADRNDLIEDKIEKSYYNLIHTEELSSVICATNATGFTCDEYNITEINIDENSCDVSIEFWASGDQDPDHGHCGTALSGSATAHIDCNGIVSYSDISAELDVDEEDTE